MKELIPYKKHLPATLEDLQKFILIGSEQLKAYRAKLNAVNKLGLAQAVRTQALDDTQKMGTALLWAEAKMGDLLKNIADPTASREGRRQLPEGITHPEEKVVSWFNAEVTKHSKKPHLVYKIIEKMYPNKKYLELFARNKQEGWTSFGNQVSKD